MFNNLVYVDSLGHSTGLNGGGTYYSSPPYLGCPPNGPQPSQIVYGDDPTGFIITWHPGQGQGSASIEFAGSVMPSYEVVSVFYAPPGHQSYADYSQTNMVGASTSVSSSFQSYVSKSVTFGYTAGSIFGSGSWKNTAGSALTQQQDSSASVDVSYNITQGYKVFGPNDDALGLYHPADQIAVWLNPVANFRLSKGTVKWTSYSWDARDPLHNIDIQYLTVYQLQNPSVMQADQVLWGYLEKSDWSPADPSGALTNNDFSGILTHDPYSSGSPSPDTTRYQGPVNGSGIPYQLPGCPACQPSNWYWDTDYSATNTQGQSAQLSYSLNFGVSYTTPSFIDLLTEDLQASGTWTWTNKWSSTQTVKVTNHAHVNIVGPSYGSGYAGPEQFNMYQDNIYGTYMFYPR